jgi:hypothetical protein
VKNNVEDRTAPKSSSGYVDTLSTQFPRLKSTNDTNGNGHYASRTRLKIAVPIMMPSPRWGTEERLEYMIGLVDAYIPWQKEEG